ncbi:MAG: hypothetical protein AABZ55_10325 [Bdellovibrionota bacterium]
MDFYSFSHYDFRRLLLQSRIRKLSTYFRTFFSIQFRSLDALRPWILLALAISLAALAHAQSKKIAVASWIKSHSPSEKIWTISLVGLGYKSFRESSKYSVALRSLPATLDEEGAVWVTASGQWIGVSFVENSLSPFAIYCLDCKIIPSNWIPIGSGWPALEAALNRADHAVQLYDSMRKAASRSRVAYQDPREIRY